MSVLHRLDSTSGHRLDSSSCCFGIIVSVNGSSNVACNRLDIQNQKAPFKLWQLDTKPNVNVAIHLFKIVTIYHHQLWMWNLGIILNSRSHLYSACDTFPMEFKPLSLSPVERNSSNAAVRGEMGMRPFLVRMTVTFQLLAEARGI